MEGNEDWSLFCPNEAPGLAEVWGEKFEELYTRYEREGRARKVVRAQQLWFAILEAQIETGNPFMLYKVGGPAAVAGTGEAGSPCAGPGRVGAPGEGGEQSPHAALNPRAAAVGVAPTLEPRRPRPAPPAQDACNRKSNQQNLGTIRCSNLCTEIVEYTAPDETAVCNLASIALPRFVRERDAQPGYEGRKLVGSLGAENRFFDFDKLAEVTRVVTENLNKVRTGLGGAGWGRPGPCQRLPALRAADPSALGLQGRRGSHRLRRRAARGRLRRARLAPPLLAPPHRPRRPPPSLPPTPPPAHPPRSST